MDFLGLAVAAILLLVIVVVARRNRTKVPRKAELVVILAKIDLSNRLEISRESIKIVEVRRVDWPDTSLGHPEPGRVYAQVITPGFVVRLEACGKLCEYHSDYTRVVVEQLGGDRMGSSEVEKP